MWEDIRTPTALPALRDRAMQQEKIAMALLTQLKEPKDSKVQVSPLGWEQQESTEEVSTANYVNGEVEL